MPGVAFDEFGPFRALFGESGGYLSLLHISAHSVNSILKLRTVVAECGDQLDHYLGVLLAEQNWRPQLVAAAALVVADAPGNAIRALWAALDRPCWTSPQLAAAASRVDRAFLVEARKRLARRCRLQISADSSMNWLERHSAIGPQSFDGHSAKLFAALAVLCQRDPDSEAWLTALLEEEDARKLLANDGDRGGEIAVRWLSGLEALL